MKINKMDHFSVAVKNLESARRIWEPILGKSVPDDCYVDESEGIRVARYLLAGVGFELMESTTPDGPVAKWIEKNGEGIMLISFNVESTREAVRELEAGDYPFIPNPVPLSDDVTEKVRPFRECEFAFLHPKRMNGVLVEFIDDKWNELN
jgi:methylmalonyl-CoA/ethylmalonyl-CoA epimerase